MLVPYLAAEYEDRVAIEYYDVNSIDADRFNLVKEVMDKRDLPLPLVAVEGEPVWAGSLDLFVIRRVLADRGMHPAR